MAKSDAAQLRADFDGDRAWKVRTDASAIAQIKSRPGKDIRLRLVRIELYIVPKKSLTGRSSERVDTRVADRLSIRAGGDAGLCRAADGTVYRRGKVKFRGFLFPQKTNRPPRQPEWAIVSF